MNEPTPQPTPPVQQDHFFRNLAVVLLLAVIGFAGYQAYESKQESDRLHQEQVDDLVRWVRERNGD